MPTTPSSALFILPPPLDASGLRPERSAFDRSAILTALLQRLTTISVLIYPLVVASSSAILQPPPPPSPPPPPPPSPPPPPPPPWPPQKWRSNKRECKMRMWKWQREKGIWAAYGGALAGGGALLRPETATAPQHRDLPPHPRSADKINTCASAYFTKKVGAVCCAILSQCYAIRLQPEDRRNACRESPHSSLSFYQSGGGWNEEKRSLSRLERRANNANVEGSSPSLARSAFSTPQCSACKEGRKVHAICASAALTSTLTPHYAVALVAQAAAPALTSIASPSSSPAFSPTPPLALMFTLVDPPSRSHGVVVSTQDFESCDPSSNLGGTWCTPTLHPPHSTSPFTHSTCHLTSILHHHQSSLCCLMPSLSSVSTHCLNIHSLSVTDAYDSVVGPIYLTASTGRPPPPPSPPPPPPPSPPPPPTTVAATKMAIKQERMQDANVEVAERKRNMGCVPPGRLELPTPGLLDQCSNP
ncbi:hypothetical protein Aperf_G00000116526 [Anoplocephala perfoliata]